MGPHQDPEILDNMHFKPVMKLENRAFIGVYQESRYSIYGLCSTPYISGDYDTTIRLWNRGLFAANCLNENLEIVFESKPAADALNCRGAMIGVLQAMGMQYYVPDALEQRGVSYPFGVAANVFDRFLASKIEYQPIEVLDRVLPISPEIDHAEREGLLEKLCPDQIRGIAFG